MIGSIFLLARGTIDLEKLYSHSHITNICSGYSPILKLGNQLDINRCCVIFFQEKKLNKVDIYFEMPNEPDTFNISNREMCIYEGNNYITTIKIRKIEKTVYSKGEIIDMWVNSPAFKNLPVNKDDVGHVYKLYSCGIYIKDVKLVKRIYLVSITSLYIRGLSSSYEVLAPVMGGIYSYHNRIYSYMLIDKDILLPGETCNAYLTCANVLGAHENLLPNFTFCTYEPQKGGTYMDCTHRLGFKVEIIKEVSSYELINFRKHDI